MLALISRLSAAPAQPTVHGRGTLSQEEKKRTAKPKSKVLSKDRLCSAVSTSRPCCGKSARREKESRDMPSASRSDDGFLRLKSALAEVKQPVFLELFAGSGRVCAYLRTRGHAALALELRHGLKVDLLSKRVRRLIKRSIRLGRISGIWLGTPCSSFSLARRGRGGAPGGPLRLKGKYILGHPRAMKRPRDKKKIVLGNKCAESTGSYALAAHNANIPWCLENPNGSRLWHHPAIARLLSLPGVERRVCHMCAYGAAFMKPTAVLMGHCSSAGLEKKCPGCSEHLILQGSNRTARAQVYPRSFAKEAALLLLKSS